MQNYYLYKITNLVNGKLYIGVTKNLKMREYQHFFARHPDNMSVIKHAIDKHGKDNFSFEVLCIGAKDYIFDLEPKAISLYDSVAPNGYNISQGGEAGAASEIKSRRDDKPLYVSGFWFPNMRTASKSLNKKKSTLIKRVTSGFVEEASSPKNYKTKPLLIYGVEYATHKEAAKGTGYSVFTIARNLKNNHPDFQYKVTDNG